MFDLTGKSALVTGASGGIGAEIARALHGAGATVGLSGTRTEPLEALASDMRITSPSRVIPALLTRMSTAPIASGAATRSIGTPEDVAAAKG